jgi:hypothetical protein
MNGYTKANKPGNYIGFAKDLFLKSTFLLPRDLPHRDPLIVFFFEQPTLLLLRTTLFYRFLVYKL